VSKALPRRRARSDGPLAAGVCLLLAACTLAVYWQAHGFAFINYDDNDYITQNPAVFHGLSWSSVKWAFTESLASNWHPLTWISHMADCQFFGVNAGAHHMVNVAWHIANAILLFFVLRRMTSRLWTSAFVAGLFALHPVHVESVAWIAERKDVLSTCFWFLSMWAYVGYARRGGALRYMVTLLLFAMGLMAKPMLVTLPFVLLLLDYWPLARFEGGEKTRALIVEKIPFLALTVASCVVTFAVQFKEAVAPVDDLSVVQRLLNALVSYFDYVRMMFWPSGLAILYPLSVEAQWGEIVMAGLFVCGVSYFAFRLRRSHPYLITGWLWYLGTLVPVIGLVQVGNQSLADRYTYVPLIGLFIIVAWGVSDLMDAKKIKQPLPAAAGCLVLAACAICSWMQVGYWKDSITLFRHALAVTRNNYVLMNNLGATLADAGHADEAIALYSEALRLKPDYANAHNNFGVALAAAGRFDDAIAHYEAALRAKPDSGDVFSNIGLALQRKGRLDEAIGYFRKALQIKPGSADAHANLGLALASQGKNEEAVLEYETALQLKPVFPNVLNNLGVALNDLRRFDEAIARYRQLLAVDPASAEAYFNMGNAFVNKGQLDEAFAHYAEFLRLQPDFANGHVQLARVLEAQGKMADALAQYREAVRLAPESTNTLNALAFFLATCRVSEFRNGREAVETAERSFRIRRDVETLNILAAAYAESGRMQDAVNASQGALEAATAAKNETLAKLIRSRLDIYKAGKPFHQPGN
jgi:tetratricopeptide (TPR) repeat protein